MAYNWIVSHFFIATINKIGDFDLNAGLSVSCIFPLSSRYRSTVLAKVNGEPKIST